MAQFKVVLYLERPNQEACKSALTILPSDAKVVSVEEVPALVAPEKSA
jgi:hypothetical protein